MDSGVIEGGLNVTLTIRLLMHGKVKSPISLSCQDSIFYDPYMEASVSNVVCKGQGISCRVHENYTRVCYLIPQRRLITLGV